MTFGGPDESKKVPSSLKGLVRWSEVKAAGLRDMWCDVSWLCWHAMLGMKMLVSVSVSVVNGRGRRQFSS